jgi:hypothetical protein
MALYDFKCHKCDTIKEFSLSMAKFDEERKNVICCGEVMDRYFSSDNLTGIRTDSSPPR